MLSSHQQTIFRVWTSSRLLCMFLVYSIIRLFAQSGSHRRTCTWSRAQSHRDVIVLMRYLVLPRNPDIVPSRRTSRSCFVTQSEVVMEGTALLQLPEGMRLDQIQITENGLVIEVVATSPTACCPLCSELSSSIHCHYRRTLRDAPCAGRRVQLFLTVRKFSCRNPYCSRKVFAERFPDFVEPWARMTIRHCQQITSVGLATCGKGGVRLAARLRIQTSRQAILRRIMDLPEVSTSSVL